MPVGHDDRDARDGAQSLDEEEGDDETLGRELGHPIDGAEDEEDRLLRWAPPADVLDHLHEIRVRSRGRGRRRVGASQTTEGLGFGLACRPAAPS